MKEGKKRRKEKREKKKKKRGDERRRNEGKKENEWKKNIYQELKMLRTQLDEFKMSERRFDNWLKGQDMKKCKFLIMA